MNDDLNGAQNRAKGRLKWDARLVAGGTPSTNETSFWTDYGALDGTPFVAIADMSGRERIDATKKALTIAGMQSRNMPVGDPGTLLLAMYASVGEVSLLGIQATWNQALLGITPDSRRVSTQYLRYVLLAMRPELLRDVRSTTQDNLNAGQIGDIQYPKPPLEEQRAIADYLDQETAQIDVLVAKQEDFIGLLKERRRIVVPSILSEARLTDDQPDKLHRRTRMGNGSTPRSGEERYYDDGTIPWVNSSVVNDPEIWEPSKRVTQAAVDECHLPMVKAGSILVALTGQGKTRGAATILRINSTINQHLAFIEPDSKFWLPEYLLWVLRSSYDDLRRISSENGATKGGLTIGDLRDLKVSMPDLNEQSRLVNKLEDTSAQIDALIAKAEEHIALAKERRSALITAAVTGQFDVRTTRKAG